MNDPDLKEINKKLATPVKFAKKTGTAKEEEHDYRREECINTLKY